MSTSSFFNNWGSSQEQELIESLIVESIQIYGMDCYYLPRTIGNYNQTYKEDDASSYNSAFIIEMHMKGTDGFGGQGDMISWLGSETRDTVTLVVAIRRFNEEVKNPTGQLRPNEGDIVYFPLNRKAWKINFVEHEAIFYQMGTLQVYELHCELFDYAGEVFNTGLDFIDSMADGYDLSVGTGNGIFEEENGLPVENEDFAGLDGALTGDNDHYQVEGQKVIDFSEIDPFTDGNEY